MSSLSRASRSCKVCGILRYEQDARTTMEIIYNKAIMKSIKIIAVITVFLLVIALLLGRYSNYLGYLHPMSKPIFLFCLIILPIAPILALMNLLNLYQYKIEFKKKVVWYFISFIPLLLPISLFVLLIYTTFSE